MNMEDIPKRYGGDLNWEWGDSPDLDRDTRQALERDGHKGWVKGPCLWLQNERVVVGSENGKLRRSDKEVAEKKPIVYAADFTEEPVHPERRASLMTGKKEPNGNSAAPPPTLPSHAATAAARAAANTKAERPLSSAQPPQPSQPSQLPQPPAQVQPTQPGRSIPQEDVRTAPMDGSQVYLAPIQAASPMSTAEYISPQPQPRNTSSHTSPPAEYATAPTVESLTAPSVESPTTSQVEHVSTPSPVEHASTPPPVAASNAPSAKRHLHKLLHRNHHTSGHSTHEPPSSATSLPSSVHSNADASSPPPSQPQPGPISAHTVAVTAATVHKMEGESISVIPADNSGPLPHPDIIAASDKGKGLAMEVDKLALAEKDSHHQKTPARPPLGERFVTAAEF